MAQPVDAPDTSDLLAQLAESFAGRWQRGERPSIDEYVAAHPELEADIRTILPALVMLEEASPTESADEFGGSLTDPPAAMPTQIADYRILRVVGRGGMGVVYEAEQEALHRRVALKVLPSHARSQSNALRRFRQEAQLAARLHHSNIVPVFDVGQDGGNWYYAMQFIDGLGLDEVMVELQKLRAADAGNGAALPSGAAAWPPSATGIAQAMLSGEFPGEATSRTDPHDTDAAEGAGDSATVMPSESEADRPGRDSSARRILLSADSTMRVSLDESEVAGATSADLRHSEAPASTTTHYFRSVARIGLQIARALTYAHGEGVLHRDIKPSNLLLDNHANVWLTDFGLAKAEESGITKTGDIVGTLQYMAPERFSGWSDARTDIYSVGITLYELLALRPAFDATDRVRMIRQITHDDLVRPTRIDRRIPRDLETIVLKATEKEPAHRYQSASQLAEDLECYINDTPLKTQRVSQRELFWRWCRRNRAVASLAASLVFVLIAGVVGMSTLWLGAVEDRNAAEASAAEAGRQEQIATDHFQEARAAVDHYLTAVAESKLKDVPGLQPLRKELLEGALEYYKQFAERAADDVDLRSDLAAAYERMGQINSLLGSTREALDAHRSAERIWGDLAAEVPRNAEYRQRLSATLASVGLLQGELGERERQRASYAQARSHAEQLANEQSNQDVHQDSLARIYGLSAQLEMASGDLEAAGENHERALAIRKELVTRSPDNGAFQNSLAAAYNEFAQQRALADDLDGAYALCDEANDVAEQLVAAHPQNVAYRSTLVACYESVATLRLENKDYALARDWLLKALPIRRALVTQNPAVGEYRAHLAADYDRLGLVYRNLSFESGRAIWHYEQCVKHLEQLAAENPAVVRYRQDLTRNRGKLADVQRQFGQYDEAERTLQANVETLKTALRGEPTAIAVGSELAACYLSLGTLQHFVRSPELATQAFDRGLEAISGVEEDRLPTGGRRTRRLLLAARGCVLTELGRSDEAIADFNAAMGLAEGEPYERYRMFRAVAESSLGDYGDAVVAAEAYLQSSGSRRIYNVEAAQVFAAATDAVLQDASLAEPRRAERSAQYGQRAVDLLRAIRATLKQTRHLQRLQTVSLYDPLRQRDDFKQLLQGLEVETRLSPLYDEYKSIVTAQWELGRLLILQAKYEDAEVACRQGVELLEKLLNDYPAHRDANWYLAIQLIDMAWYVSYWQGERAAPPLAANALAISGRHAEVAFQHAAWHLYCGDDQSYEDLCRQTLDQIDENPTYRMAYLVARMGCLAPTAATDVERCVELAEQAARENRMNHDLHTLGLALLRAGRADEAIARFKESDEFEPAWLAKICNWLGTSIAHHQAGRTEEAAKWLQKSRDWIEANPLDYTLFIHWHDRIAAELLLREAEGLISGSPKIVVP